MATTTLTLYKHTKLDDMKNFVVDDLAAYLSTKASETITGFQYQRFEIQKTIKLDKSQSYLLKGQALNKYDYCKLSLGDADYFYFILRASWKAEETIELELKMDTLNTFGFSNVASDSTYTLSNKTLVTREHKDRIKFAMNEYFYEKKINLDTSLNISKWINGQVFYGTICLEYDYKNFLQEYREQTPTLTLPMQIAPNTQTISVIVVDANGYILQEYTNITQILISNTKFAFYVGLFDLYEYDSKFQGRFLIQVSSSLGDTPTSFGTAWTFMKDFVLHENITYFSFEKETDHIYSRIVEQYQEGLSTYLFKNKEETLYDGDGEQHWYVVFASTYSPVVDASKDTQSKYVNPIAIRYYSDDGYELSSSSPKLVTYYAKDCPDYPDYGEYILLNRETLGTGYFEYNGVQYHASDIPSNAVGFVIYRSSKNLFGYLGIYEWQLGFRTIWHNILSGSTSFIRFYNIDSIPLYKAAGGLATAGVNRTETIYIGSGGGSTNANCPAWENINLTDPMLIKAFAFPYVPNAELVGKTFFDSLPKNMTYSTDGQCLEVVSPQKEAFSRIIDFGQDSPFNDLFVLNPDIGNKKARNISLESKLFHSDYHQAKFVYDSFAFSFNLEDVDVSKVSPHSKFQAQYNVSKNVVSKFSFMFGQYLCKRETQNYNNVLTIERNNEKALFTNAYLNYIKSGGFSYDTKKASSQNAVNGITTALSVMGGTASLIAGWGTGNVALATGGIALLSSSAAMITRNIHTAQEQDRAISQKMLQNHVQGTSVQGCEDIDILTAICGNKAKLCYYNLSTTMQQAMWDLFHYCGYATHEQKIPDVTTRLYFNFVQADIVFDEFTFNEDIADDIRNKWKEGVTFFHKVNNEWDIEQEYENFEVSLI